MYIEGFKRLMLILFCFGIGLYALSGKRLYAQQNPVEEALIEQLIKTGEISALDAFIQNGLDANYIFTKTKNTLLQTAVTGARSDMAVYLLKKGAAPNYKGKKKYPLLMAVNLSNELMVKELLRFGADSLLRNGNGYRFLKDAAETGNLEICTDLIRAGAWPGDRWNINQLINLRDVSGSPETVAYFTNLYFLVKKYPAVGSFTDGPYIRCLNNDSCEVVKAVRDEHHKTNRLQYAVDDCNQVVLNALNLPSGAVSSFEEVCHPDWDTHYFTENPILALGDFHGDYKNLVYFLKSNKVIDDHLNWSWSSGNLIITGDIFDRGDQVTECLWLIIKLQIQAQLQGGKVHFLLGNHEIMALTGNTGYLSDKYSFMCHYFNLNYKELFDPESVFGKWLRSRNSVIKVNNIMFLHAGISEKVFNTGLDIDSINSIVRNSIWKSKFSDYTEHEKLIMGPDGPLWYRGYMGQYGYTDEPVSQETVDKILDSFKCRALVIAHSEIEHISVTYKGKVFGIDVLMVDNENSVPQGLLIENGKFFRLFPDGVKEMLYE